MSTSTCRPTLRTRGGDLFFPQHELHAAAADAAEVVAMLDTTVPILSATHLTVFKRFSTGEGLGRH
jgi:hypothetical protein